MKFLKKPKYLRNQFSQQDNCLHFVFYNIIDSHHRIIFLKYLTHDKITSLYEIAKYSNGSIGILGMIPLIQTKIPISHLIIDKSPKSLLTESFRAIRTNLQFIANEKKSRIIGISSTISGEGKTFLAINLAGIIAFTGKKVIVLDLDMRKPKIHLGFGIKNVKGMSTLLIGKDEIDNCINHSELPGLDYITAGPLPPNPSELIVSNNFLKVINELKLKYDMIVIDNPPVGLVTDGIPVLQMADYPIYVFKANFSRKNFIQNVDRLMNENNLTKLSVVLMELMQAEQDTEKGIAMDIITATVMDMDTDMDLSPILTTLTQQG